MYSTFFKYLIIYFVLPTVICDMFYNTQHVCIFVNLCLIPMSVIIMDLSYSMPVISFYSCISAIHVIIS